jgi:hypothetical protein
MCGGRLQPRSPRGAYRWDREIAFAEESEDLIGRQAGTGNDFASDAGIANMLREGLEAFDFGACRGGIVVIANPRGFRGRDNQGVIRVEEDEIGAKLDSLRKGKLEGFLVGGNLGGEEDGGGFAPTGLENLCHGNLPLVHWIT